MCAGLTDFEALADAQNGRDSVTEAGLDLRVQDFIGLVMDGAALTVAHQDVGTSQLAEELT
ncbi:hypothetical protein D3C72_2599510 [compost metagenome]